MNQKPTFFNHLMKKITNIMRSDQDEMNEIIFSL